MKYYFKVFGDVPPKKGGDLSIWGKPTGARRLEKLRRAARDALQDSPPLRRDISLTLTVHVGPINDRNTGDLDSFIAGVCDGLMAAHAGSKLHYIWAISSSADIHPRIPLAIVDDCQVMSITAIKIVGDTQEPWYEVILEGQT